MTRERLERVTAESNRWLKNGNKIPFPDGHSWKTGDNRGFWPGPLMIQDGNLYAVVQPTSKVALEQIKEAMRSGTVAASLWPTMPPIDRPQKCTRSSPSASSRPTASSARSSIVYPAPFSGSGGQSVRP